MKLPDLDQWGHSSASRDDILAGHHGIMSGIRRFEVQRQNEEAEKTVRALQLVITLLGIAAAGTLWAVFQILARH